MVRAGNAHRRGNRGSGMITPFEYVRDCCPPCYPVGALFCQAREDAKNMDWTDKEIQEAHDQITIRHNEGSRFVFPNGVRYI